MQREKMEEKMDLSLSLKPLGGALHFAAGEVDSDKKDEPRNACNARNADEEDAAVATLGKKTVLIAGDVSDSVADTLISLRDFAQQTAVSDGVTETSLFLGDERVAIAVAQCLRDQIVVASTSGANVAPATEEINTYLFIGPAHETETETALAIADDVSHNVAEVDTSLCLGPLGQRTVVVPPVDVGPAHETDTETALAIADDVSHNVAEVDTSLCLRPLGQRDGGGRGRGVGPLVPQLVEVEIMVAEIPGGRGGRGGGRRRRRRRGRAEEKIELTPEQIRAADIAAGTRPWLYQYGS